ncbi:transferrin-binding protein-like solute binding protein [uncultured Paracoccus sp.]|uniref:transferrin-binding protein-like solute binding protein n=1 Tax=uncultured Paracoccus sp. TaxID=189685 RepID=UPI00260D413E|nr:transferrin-binding protein-like solute binding protein [uncultured Paracoccus sp.]
MEKWEDTDYTTEAQMPTGGTASYRGVAEYGDGEVLSSAEMQANFSNATLSGRLHNFQAQNGTPVAGDVAIHNGAIRGASYSADLSGSLSAAGERAMVSGDVYGDFSGGNAEIVDGVIDAQLDSSAGREYISGQMVLTR